LVRVRGDRALKTGKSRAAAGAERILQHADAGDFVHRSAAQLALGSVCWSLFGRCLNLKGPTRR
jgi:hypothetical protein